MKRLALTLLATAAFGTQADAQQGTAVTKTFTYELVDLRISPSVIPEVQQPVEGVVFLEDVSAWLSRFVGYLRDTSTGELLFDCRSGNVFSDDPNAILERFDRNIVQVGPFAQQAVGNLDSGDFMEFVRERCAKPPESLTLSCPFRGLNSTQDPSHVNITQNGTFGGGGGSYAQKGHQNGILCEVTVNDVVYEMLGTLSNIKETRRRTTINLEFVNPSFMVVPPTGFFVLNDFE